MQRILQGRSAILTQTFQADGVATDPSPDSATVTITRDDGTVIVDGQAATEAGTGVVTYTLTPAMTATLDLLTVRWAATFGAQAQTFTDQMEVRGGVLFTIADARRMKPFDSATSYPADVIVAARTLAETALEEAARVPFVPTYFRRTLDGDARTDLLLPVVRPLSITSVTVDGDAVDTSTVRLYDDGRLYCARGWVSGPSAGWMVGRPRSSVVVTGTYGYPYPPPRVSHACLLLAKRWAVDSPVSDRATSMTTEDGTTQMLVTAGVRQAVFDVPECNSVIREYGARAAYAIA
jgi:hypothetical protein